MGTRPENLEMCTALGSTLDYNYGVDGFFVFEGTVSTFDVTTNPHKDEPEKRAQVLVRLEDALNGFELVAQDIAWHLKRCWRTATAGKVAVAT